MHFSIRLPALAVFACFGSLACARDQSPTEPPAAAIPESSLSPILFPDKWVIGMDMPTARFSLTAATVNGVIYLIGGQKPGGEILRHGYVYYPEITTSAAWRRMAPLPKARALTNGAVVINGKIYVSGGADTTGMGTKSLFIYDPATYMWSYGAEMPEPSFAGVSGAIDGKLYVLVTPQQEGGTSFSRLYRFDPVTQTWTVLAASQYNHKNGMGGVIGGKFYVVGGGDEGSVRRELEVYDPATNTWTYQGLIPTGRWGAASAVLNGKLYVAGGRAEKGGEWPGGKVEMYDPSTNSWSTKRSMPTARYGAGGTVRNGRFYVIGGSNDGRANEYYVPGP